MHQSQYLKNMEFIPYDSSFKQFSSMRMKLEWLANTRPDCLFEISQLAQVTEEKFDSQRASIIRRQNRAVKYAVDNRILLRVCLLEKERLKVVSFSDSSFASNDDLSSQLGHIIFLGDASNNFIQIHFKS